MYYNYALMKIFICNVNKQIVSNNETRHKQSHTDGKFVYPNTEKVNNNLLMKRYLFK